MARTHASAQFNNQINGFRVSAIVEQLESGIVKNGIMAGQKFRKVTIIKGSTSKGKDFSGWTIAAVGDKAVADMNLQDRLPGKADFFVAPIGKSLMVVGPCIQNKD